MTESTMWLVVRSANGEEQVHPLSEGMYTLGREETCEIHLAGVEISRRHARLAVAGNELWLADLGSANGTQVEGAPLTPRLKTRLGLEQHFSIAGYDLYITAQQPAALSAPVLEEAAPAPVDAAAEKLTFQYCGEDGAWQCTELSDGEYIIGRGAEAHIRLESDRVSRRHAVLTCRGGQLTLRDTGSTNGTFKMGERLPANVEVPLAPGEVIEIGPFRLLAGGALVGMETRAIVPGAVAIAAPLQAAGTQLHQHESTSPPGAVQTYPLALGGAEKLTFGRDADNSVLLDHPQVSRYHAIIEQVGARSRLVDLQSTNGVYLNGERITREAWLQQGDTIGIGPYSFIFTGRAVNMAAAGGYTIQARRLRKQVSRQLNILQDISLNLQPNEFVAIVGMSGAGKTTLMDAICGYRPATSGRVLVNGVDLYQQYDRFRNEIGYVPQRDIVHMELTVQQALDYAAQLRMPSDTTRPEREKAVHQVLREMGLTERKDVPIAQLSGGQQKRVSIGVELLTRPRLFFLDEPTSGLDPGTEYDMMKLLRRIADQGRTVVLVTHATKNVMLCDKVIIMAKGGYLAFYGAPEEALAYFDQHRTRREQLEKNVEFDDIYRILSDAGRGTPRQWAERFLAYRKAAPAAEPSQPVARRRSGKAFRRVNGLRQLFILSARNLRMLRQDKVTLALMLAVAPILGFVNLIWGRQLFDPVEGDSSRMLLMWFMTAITAFLMGSLASVREIVKENDIYKRERAVGLGVLPYIFSKIWVGVVLSLYQGGVFLLLLVAFVNPVAPTPLTYLAYYITMCLGILCGYLTGLLISAAVPNQNAALIMLIVILIPNFLFTGALLPLDDNPILDTISYVMPARWSFEGFVRTSDVGALVIADPCWQLSETERAALTDEEKSACPCTGENIFTTCNTIPGILSSKFYGEDEQQALAMEEPQRPPEPTALPTPNSASAPTPLPTPRPLPTPKLEPPTSPKQLSEIQQQQTEYLQRSSQQLLDYLYAVRNQLDTFMQAQYQEFIDYSRDSQEQFEAYADTLDDFGETLKTWQENRQKAIVGAESIIRYLNEKYARTFRGSIWGRWAVEVGNILLLTLLIFAFQKRKDVV